MTSVEEIEDFSFCPPSCTCDGEEGLAQIYYHNHLGIATQRTVWIDSSTNDCYRNDSCSVLSTKCFLIFVATPVYLAVHTVWHIAQIPVRLGWVIHESYEMLLKEKTIYNIFMATANIAFGIPCEFLINICNLVKSAFYALAIEVFSVIGFVLPFYARVQIASLERSWHEGGLSQDVRHYTVEESCEEYIKNSFFEKTSQHAIFIAYCFQPVRNLDQDPIDRLDRHRFSVSVSLPGETQKLAFFDFLPLPSKG